MTGYMRDVHSGTSLVSAIGNAEYHTTVESSAVELISFQGAEIILAIGVGGVTFNATDRIEFKLTHSADDATYTAVELKHMLGLASIGSGGIIKSLITEHAAAAVYRFGYIAALPYLKLKVEFFGTHVAPVSGNPLPTPIAGIIWRSMPSIAPLADQR